MIEMALSHVDDPDLGQSLIQLGMIENIAIDGTKVSFDLVLTTPACPMKSKMKEDCIKAIHEYAPEVKVGGALSNISFGMPLRKYVNVECLTLALEAGLDSCIMDPSSALTMGALYAYEALAGSDTGGRKYNRAYRKGILK
jgi:5-methyltetrahydrofolate--homocysteine methyltransferase